MEEMGVTRARRGRNLRSILAIPLFLILLPVLVVVLPVYLLARWAKGRVIVWGFRRTWGRQGKVAVFVYSDSPNWKEYIETEVLPRIADRVVTLNWSQRAQWTAPRSVEVRVFRHWSGDHAFNPMAIVVPHRGPVRTIRFWEAFRDFKHGKVESLRQQEQVLYESIQSAA